MTNLKDLFLEIKEDEVADDDGVEVYADSVKQALQLASEDLEVDISMLDYEIQPEAMTLHNPFQQILPIP